MFDQLFSLKNKTAIITGASSGLGRRFAEILSAAGADVIVCARRIERLEMLCCQIKTQGSKATAMLLDVAEPNSIKQVIENLRDLNIDIDILINAAGVSGLTPIDAPHNEMWDKQYAVNLRGLWLMTQGVSQIMIERKVAGSIINISSINGGDVPYFKAAAYCATKAGVVQLTKQLVGELSPHNIRINSILPGLFYTEMTQQKIDNNTTEFVGNIPVGFVADPSDLDGMILYLSSNNASRYVTGTCIPVDGGVSALFRLEK